MIDPIRQVALSCLYMTSFHRLPEQKGRHDCYKLTFNIIEICLIKSNF